MDQPQEMKPRIAALDVARGIALLGIFFVNAPLFGEPFASVFEPGRPADEGWLSQFVYGFTMLFCAGKFYPLFSLLFGAGLAIMFESARRDGRNFVATYIRRLALLALFGALHIVLLWMGDILLLYAMIGSVMLLLAYASPRVLLWIAAASYGVGILILAGLTTVMVLVEMPEPEVKEMPVAESKFAQYIEVLTNWNQTEQYDSRLAELETQYMSQGPFYMQVVVRLFNYMFATFFTALVMTWVILPCFCVGATLVKLQFFSQPWPILRQRLVWAGVGLGLPLNLIALLLAQYSQQFPPATIVHSVALQIGGPLMSLMYLVLVMNWVDSGRGHEVATCIGNLGRMALTGYLLESLLMSAVMLHWGLARFGSTTWAERGAWVVGIYLLILLFANLWLSKFRLGPLEWLWRIGTYAKWVPLKKV